MDSLEEDGAKSEERNIEVSPEDTVVASEERSPGSENNGKENRPTVSAGNASKANTADRKREEKQPSGSPRNGATKTTTLERARGEKKPQAGLQTRVDKLPSTSPRVVASMATASERWRGERGQQPAEERADVTPLRRNLRSSMAPQVGQGKKPPSGSRNANPHFFEDLAEIVSSLTTKFPGAELIVLGDFNSRTGTENISLVGGNTEEDDKRWPNRNSKDKILNGEGRDLLAFCDVFNLEIMNGKYGRDLEGQLTFIGANGGSVIDYILCSMNLIERIADFWVEDRIESQHSPVVLQIHVQSNNKNKGEIRVWTENRGRTVNRYKWKSELQDTFLTNLNEQLQGRRGESAETLTNILRTAAGSMVERRKNKGSKRDDWYDDECRVAKKMAEEALRVFRRVGNDESRIRYVQLRRNYKDIIQLKKTNWELRKAGELSRVVENGDISEMWHTIKRIRGGGWVRNEITPEVWREYFRGVYGEGEMWGISDRTGRIIGVSGGSGAGRRDFTGRN
ncbi:hypothetical protein ANN_24806 [Periplaneta americana]|uniref:Endonuclease/exonuclease/phosphatase domain-containing protein n=1 Tax=Periplaneta americana TaxID=6978 RepID=A0ABQ8RZX2_PERAM|nr:hypothetical protein ANN_24806 [Periplaneta americana]